MNGRHWVTLTGLALTLVAAQQPALAQSGDAGEERCGKTAATCVTTVKTFGKIAATSARTVETFRVIDEISGRIFNQERARDRSHETGGTFTKTGRMSGKIIGISGTTAMTDAETGKAYGTTWLAAKDTTVKHS
ncbi:MAG TPA: hypothetical protein VK901_20075 [Nitrospiraceae bacterium]|nr:hypothetical protein [Nitrospiraceae bacterium]